jgi:prophage regulatory protein
MKVIRWPTLQEKLDGVSSVTVWRWEKDGVFPKRVKIGPNTTGWIESEVDDFLTERAAER